MAKKCRGERLGGGRGTRSTQDEAQLVRRREAKGGKKIPISNERRKKFLFLSSCHTHSFLQHHPKKPERMLLFSFFLFSHFLKMRNVDTCFTSCAAFVRPSLLAFQTATDSHPSFSSSSFPIISCESARRRRRKERKETKERKKIRQCPFLGKKEPSKRLFVM